MPQISKQQAAFLLTPLEEVLYGGAVGGGKTAALLMGALQYVDVPGYAALILRRTFPELEQPEGPIWQSLRWFGQVPEHIRPRYVKGDHTWEFRPGGGSQISVIRFGHLDSADALLRYQGGGYHYIAFDELTHFEEEHYEFIGLSRQRRPPSGPLSEVPMRIRASANPGGPGHVWVKKRFVDKRRSDVAFIPAKVWDNPGIDTDDYVARLGKLNPVLRQQLLDGDWGAFEGLAFEEWDEDTHVVPDMEIPRSWERFESMDYGLNNPTAWLAWAVDYDGNIVIYDTYYQPGLPSETAPVILARRRSDWFSHLCYGDPQSLATRTGSQRWQRFGEPATIETEFEDAGVPIIRANNNPKSGYTRLRELVKTRFAEGHARAGQPVDHRFPEWHARKGQPGSPRLFVIGQHCAELVEQFETAPLQPIDKRHGGEIIDPEWEGRHGHAIAAARYGAMSRPDPSPEPDPQAGVPGPLREGWNEAGDAEEMRAEALARHESRLGGRPHQYADV